MKKNKFKTQLLWQSIVDIIEKQYVKVTKVIAFISRSETSCTYERKKNTFMLFFSNGNFYI